MLAPLEDRSVLAGDTDLARLRALCDRQRRQLAEYASGAAIIDLGRKLMELSEANAQLRDAAQRAGLLERALAAAGAESLRLSAERDALRREITQLSAQLRGRGQRYEEMQEEAHEPAHRQERRPAQPFGREI